MLALYELHPNPRNTRTATPPIRAPSVRLDVASMKQELVVPYPDKTRDIFQQSQSELPVVGVELARRFQGREHLRFLLVLWRQLSELRPDVLLRRVVRAHCQRDSRPL